MQQQRQYNVNYMSAPAIKPGVAVAFLAPATGILSGTTALSG